MDLYFIAQQKGWPEELSVLKYELLPFNPKTFQDITVILFGAIGDGVCLLYALKAFKEQFPDVIVRIIVEHPLDEFMQCSFIDEVIVFDEPDFARIKELKKETDIVLNLHSTYRSALLAYFLAGKNALGLSINGKEVFLRGNLWQLFFHRVFYPKFLHKRLEEVNILGRVPMLSLCLGIKPYKLQALPRIKSDDSNFEIRGEYIVIVPDANAPSRIWPLDKYIVLAEKILDRFADLSVVFIGKDVKGGIKTTERLFDLRGKTSLSSAIDIISNARYLLSNDTGMIHIAGVFQIPTLIVCGPNNVGPEAKGRYLSVRKIVDCSPCREAFCESMKCMKELSVEDVFSCFRKLVEFVDGKEDNSSLLDRKDLSIGYSYDEEVDLFFDYHPFTLPYEGKTVLGDALYRYLIVFIYLKESGIDIPIMEFKDYIKRHFVFSQQQLKELQEQIGAFFDSVKRPLLLVVEKVGILKNKNVSSLKVLDALKKVCLQVPEELIFPLSDGGLSDIDVSLARAVDRCVYGKELLIKLIDELL